MPEIKFDVYSGKWWLTVKDQNTALTFEQLETFYDKIGEMVSEERSKQLQADLLGDTVCDGCTI